MTRMALGQAVQVGQVAAQCSRGQLSTGYLLASSSRARAKLRRPGAPVAPRTSRATRMRTWSFARGLAALTRHALAWPSSQLRLLARSSGAVLARGVKLPSFSSYFSVDAGQSSTGPVSMATQVRRASLLGNPAPDAIDLRAFHNLYFVAVAAVTGRARQIGTLIASGHYPGPVRRASATFGRVRRRPRHFPIPRRHLAR